MAPVLLLPKHSPQFFRRYKGLSLSRVYIRHYAASAQAAPKRKKVWGSADAAVLDVKSGDMVLSGGMSMLTYLNSS
jgi:3-oxoacid CoA-transferase